jgi:hypothetical protein
VPRTLASVWRTLDFVKAATLDFGFRERRDFARQRKLDFFVAAKLSFVLRRKLILWVEGSLVAVGDTFMAKRRKRRQEQS